MTRSETPYGVKNRLILVEAKIFGPRGSVPVRLIVDTAAALTTLQPEVIDLAGYSSRDGIRPTRVRSAVSEEDGYELQLASLTALGFTIDGHMVNVFDLGLGKLGDGLLGMNFLELFNFEIRPAERRILAEQLAR